jgi:hypothetical protein
LIAVLVARAAASPIAPVPEPEPEPDASEPDELDLLPASPLEAAPRLPREPAEQQELAAHVPPASSVVAAAYRAAGLADDPGPGWRRRARLAGLMPTVTVRDGRDAAWRDVSDPTIAYVSVLGVAATWHLERLVFDPNELRISAIEAGRRRDRRRIAALAIRTYYAWLELAAAAARDPRWAPRAAEAAAQLDALTEGWFSQNLPATRPPDQALKK